MEQTFWISVLVISGATLRLSVLGPCPYNVSACLCTRRSIVCSNLTSIPPLASDNSDGSIQALTFQHSSFDHIEDNSLPPNLKNLTFSNVDIKHISPDALGSSSATLKSFTLTMVNFHELPEALLRVTSLEDLVISETKFQHWTNTVLQHLGRTVETLVVDFAGLMVFPEWFSYFPMVKHVSMSGDEFIKLSFDEFRHVRNLTFLSIRQNKITPTITCSDDVAMFNTLETLDAFGNSIKTFPTCISRMTKLRVLDLSVNYITLLTSDMIPVQLRELHFSYNDIYTLNDTSFPHSSALEIIVCSWCQMNNISSLAFKPLKYLRSLNLMFNFLDRFPLALTKLKRLEIVGLYWFKCEHPLELEAYNWYKVMNNTRVNGGCGDIDMSADCYLSNDRHCSKRSV